MRARPPVAVSALKAAAWLLLALYLVHIFTAGTDEILEGPPRPAVVDAPATVFEQHADDCWTGEAPADVDMPGHVIWQHPDGRTVYSARLVGPALDTLFGDGDLAGRPVAFCR